MDAGAGVKQAFCGGRPARPTCYSLTAATCRGTGARGAGRFTSFRCSATFNSHPLTDPSPVYKTVFVKVRRVGSGQVCAALRGLSAIPAGCLSTGGAPRLTRLTPDKSPTIALERNVATRLGTSTLWRQGSIGVPLRRGGLLRMHVRERVGEGDGDGHDHDEGRRCEGDRDLVLDSAGATWLHAGVAAWRTSPSSLALPKVWPAGRGSGLRRCRGRHRGTRFWMERIGAAWGKPVRLHRSHFSPSIGDPRYRAPKPGD